MVWNCLALLLELSLGIPTLMPSVCHFPRPVLVIPHNRLLHGQGHVQAGLIMPVFDQYPQPCCLLCQRILQDSLQEEREGTHTGQALRGSVRNAETAKWKGREGKDVSVLVWDSEGVTNYPPWIGQLSEPAG